MVHFCCSCSRKRTNQEHARAEVAAGQQERAHHSLPQASRMKTGVVLRALPLLPLFLLPPPPDRRNAAPRHSRPVFFIFRAPKHSAFARARSLARQKQCNPTQLNYPFTRHPVRPPPCPLRPHQCLPPRCRRLLLLPLPQPPSPSCCLASWAARACRAASSSVRGAQSEVHALAQGQNTDVHTNAHTQTLSALLCSLAKFVSP